jgi:hypothetical protein
MQQSGTCWAVHSLKLGVALNTYEDGEREREGEGGREALQGRRPHLRPYRCIPMHEPQPQPVLGREKKPKEKRGKQRWF